MNRRLALAAVGLAVLVGWGVERLIVTDTEAIEAVLEGAAKSVSKADWDGLAAAIDDEYAERGRDKRAFVAYVRTTYERFRPAGVGVEVADTTVDGDRAAARIVVAPGAPYVGMKIAGRVELVRQPEGWRISGVASDELNVLGR